MGKIYRFIEPAILMLLEIKGFSYGYDLAESVQQFGLAESSVESAALYRTLRILEKNGHVRSRWESDHSGPSRRVYCLTPAGRQHLREWGELMERLGNSLLGFSRQVKRKL